MKIAYFDCFAGAAGDMIVAAMLDAGLNAQFLKKQLATLGIDDLDIKITETKRSGLRALKFEPAAKTQHHHRNLEDITKIINKSKITENTKQTAISIFQKLANAEAVIHNKPIDKIHFHEVGAIDSIADIVAASIGLEAMGIEKVYCSTLTVGGGTVKCDHGSMPVPAPATAELLKGIQISGGPIQAELLTPTAAAILTTITDHFGPLPQMTIDAIGYGAGSMDPDQFPNVLRLIIGQTAQDASAETDTICLLETNIDDATGETIGYAINKLLDAGALDAYTTPIYMKQNRPAAKLSVICNIKDEPALEQVIFEQGITFGIRRQLLTRTKLAREFLTVQTDFGPIRVKIGKKAGETLNAKAEYSDCVKAAENHNTPLKAVIDAAMTAYRKTMQ